MDNMDNTTRDSFEAAYAVMKEIIADLDRHGIRYESLTSYASYKYIELALWTEPEHVDACAERLGIDTPVLERVHGVREGKAKIWPLPGGRTVVVFVYAANR